jgi:tRNA nucleotidyltransferase (CCA-adding enzyme)
MDILKALPGLFPAAHHKQVFLVGGSVRDILLGRSGMDIDLAAVLPDEVLRAGGFRLVTGKTRSDLVPP